MIYQLYYCSYSITCFIVPWEIRSIGLRHLIDMDTGSHTFTQKRFEWIDHVLESELIHLEKWRRRPFSCPYRQFNMIWIIACSEYVNEVIVLV